MPSKSLQRRLRVFCAAVVVVTLVLTSRLAWLQIYQHEYYLRRAEDNRRRSLSIAATRGEIFDANGILLASNRPGYAVSILDLRSQDAPRVIAYLSELLDMEEEQIKGIINQQFFRRFAPIRIASDVSPEIVAKIEERRMDLPGVIIEYPPLRWYEFGSLGAHIIGYMNSITREQLRQAEMSGIYYGQTDLHGQDGLELNWERYLRGQDGTLWVEKNRLGRRTRVLGREEPVAGSDLTLTVDARLQEISERVMGEVINELREQGNNQVGRGALVALDPRSGAILAMVSYPSYNLNTFRQDYPALAADASGKPLFNKAISGGFPVGSTFKMVAAVGALEEGLIDERSLVNCPGIRQFFRAESPRQCFNATAHGPLNVVRSLAVSCNIFYFEMAMRLGVDRLTRYAEDFGFGEYTGLRDIPGEARGILDSNKRRGDFQPGDTLTAAIGQGHMVTPLQLANFAAMLANGGTHFRPYLVQRVADHRGNVLFEAEPEVLRQLDYSEKTWEIVRRGMEAVAQPGGTGAVLRLLPVRVAGKTGSAQAGSAGSGIMPHSLFTGYLPADNPRIALAVIVEHGGLSRTAAVPVVSRVLSEYYAAEAAEEGSN